jgi:hypothetical protein
MLSSGVLRHVTLIRTNVSKEYITSIVRVTRIGKLGTLTITSNQSMLQHANADSCHPDGIGDMFLLPKHQFLQEPHSVTSQKTAFFIVTSVKSSNQVKGLLPEAAVLFHFLQWNQKLLLPFKTTQIDLEACGNTDGSYAMPQSRRLWVQIPMNKFQTNISVYDIGTRRKDHFHLPLTHLSSDQRRVYYSGIKLFNTLPTYITELQNNKKYSG